MIEVYPPRFTAIKRTQRKRLKNVRERIRKLPFDLKNMFEDDILTASENRLTVLETIRNE